MAVGELGGVGTDEEGVRRRTKADWRGRNVEAARGQRGPDWGQRRDLGWD